jgi:RHS repeat-associated protein
LVAVTDPLGHTTSYTYDDFDRATAITDANGGVTAMAYDAAGNLLSLTDPDGNTTAWTYDGLNRVTSETNELGATRSFQYDAAGQQTRRTDRDGRVTVYAYDALGRMTAEAWYANASDADAGCENGTGSNQDDSCPSQFSPATNVIHYEYDAAGRLVSEWDEFSSYSYTYDALDRVVTETVANPDAPVVVFTTGYDPSSPLPPGEGQGERALRTSFSATIGGVADFQRTYQYDALGQMVHIGQTGQTGGNAVAAIGIDLRYDASGRLTGLDRYLGTALVATSTWQYDARGNLTSLVHYGTFPLPPGEGQGEGVLAEYAWTYDAAGRLTDAMSSDGTVHYTYDATGQLTGADYTAAAGLPTEPPPDETYAYDANGNRTTVTYSSLSPPASPLTYITGPNNEILFDGTYRYTYDPEGNRTARFIWTDADADGQVDSGERSQITDYAWDNRNRLVSVTDYATDGGSATQVVQYSYDTHNRWISRTVDPDGAGTQSADATYFVYDGTQIVLTFVDPDGPCGSSSPTLASRLLWGPAVDQLLADEQLSPLPPGEGQGEGRLLFPLSDHLNTVRDLAEFDAATGITAIVNHRTFDAYGQLLAETNAAVDCLFAFTGRPFDEATGLQYNLHRWYAPILGRWVSQDPYGFVAGEGNLSRYVAGSPVTGTDSTGLETRKIRGLSNVKAEIRSILDKEMANRGGGEFVSFVARNFLKDANSAEQARSEKNGMVEGVRWISESLETIVKTCRGRTIVGLEIQGHTDRTQLGTITIGSLPKGAVQDGVQHYVSPERAAVFGRVLREDVFQGKKGLIILTACVLGNFTKTDKPGDPRSLAQLVANETGCVVLSPGGFSEGSFARFFCSPEGSSALPKTHSKYFDGRTLHAMFRDLTDTAHESDDDVWYLTTPDVP